MDAFGDEDGIYGNDEWEEEEVDDFEDDAHNFQSRRRTFAQSILPDEDEFMGDAIVPQPSPVDHFVPFNPNCDVTQQRPGFQIVDNVSYYGIASLMTLLYANVSEGIPIPAIFDSKKQSM
jgi:hypothetical protein